MLAFIDGSNGSVAISVNSNAIQCFINAWTARIVREFTERTTFCTTGGWRSRLPGMKQLIGTFTGFLAKGVAGANPLSYMTGTAPQPYVITADTGCNFTFLGHAREVGAGQRAGADSSFDLNFESDGPVSVEWVVA